MMILRPTKYRDFNKKIYGFDIETYDENREFLLASVYGNGIKETFNDKKTLIDFFKNPLFNGSYIAATNLGFDFFGTFYNQKEEMDFNLLFRGSNLIYAKTYIKDKKFNKKHIHNSHSLCFIDTMNYVPMSVDDLGKIIGIKKLRESVSTFIGKKPKTNEEMNIMKKYNLRDSEISQKIISFFFDSFNRIGANPKLTIASTAMSLFKNKYLNRTYFTHDVDVLLNEFKAYYGGNTHAYCRGLIKDYNYYDFNSLYPFVMMNEFPDPDTMRVTTKGTIFYIDNFEGISSVEIECPYMEYPLLPYRTSNKLIFPYGSFSGWYTHVELRKAVDLGYVIKKIRKTIYFKNTCYPFGDYIRDLYMMRMEFKNNNNPMEIITKLLMNSLYGKFGQRFTDRDNWLPFNHTVEELNKLDFFERIGNYIRIKKDMTRPSSFCFPIWSSYVTAYARIKLYDLIIRCKPLYVDTDSVITKKEFVSSNQIGKLKLVSKIKEGVIVKPKFYMIKTDDNVTAKIKGVGVKVSLSLFMDILNNKKVDYRKFLKFKEALRRNMLPNQIIDMEKVLNIEDDKRLWDEKFNENELQISKPLRIIDGITELEYEKSRIKVEMLHQKEQRNLLSSDSQLYEEHFGDFFDSIGDDISKEEFFKNETNWRDFE